MRVYLPATLPMLRAALDRGELGPPPLEAYAATPALRESFASADTEELEYAAQLAAAQACLPLLAADPDAPRRRLVLAVDAPAAEFSAEHPALVRLDAAVPVRLIAAALLDDPAAEAAVTAALADPTDDFLLGQTDDADLGCYAPSELRHL